MKKLYIILIITSVITLIALSTQAQTFKSFDFLGYKAELLGDKGAFDFDVNIEVKEPGLGIATLILKNKKKAKPPRFSLKWSMASNGTHGYWSSRSGFNRVIQPDWYPTRVSSKLAKNAPVMTLLGSDGSNKLTYAVSEAKNTVTITSSVREEDARIYCQIDFFKEKHQALKKYVVQIRFDARNIQYHESLRQVSQWWEKFDGFEPAGVPEHAKLPMYSTWYSYHQKITAKALLEECKVAKKIGYESIIVDDGWQTLDSKRGYAYTGDWEPERIPAMKELVKGVHALGMKFLLWYAVPLVGEKSKIFSKFKGKYLKRWKSTGSYFLDPRYPEVRIHIIDTYKKALQEWKVDGFKFDFLGRFVAYKHTVLELGNGRDYASVNEATDRLMTDIIEELRKVNPDIMVEFRQPYIGPLMRKYGNIFRAGDCPNSALENRIQTTNLRLLSGNTAVHADMLMWQTNEPVELAALQLLNVLYAVPQISVRLNKIPKDHFDMVKYYNNYWRENREVLLNGRFEALSPMANYAVLKSENKEKLIVTLFENQWLKLAKNNAQKIDIVNAKLSKRVVLDITQDLGKVYFEIKDCMGRVVKKGNKNLKCGLIAFDVPVSGMLSLKRK